MTVHARQFARQCRERITTQDEEPQPGTEDDLQGTEGDLQGTDEVSPAAE